MYTGPINWWVQSVMPVVFDNSLSYYEVLAKLTNYITGVMNDVNEIEKILATIEGIEDIAEFTRFLETIQAEIGNLSNLSTLNKNDLVSALNEVAQIANSAYKKPNTGIPESDLSDAVKEKLNSGGGSGGTSNYNALNNKPSINGVTLEGNLTGNTLGLGNYSKPSGGIPESDLSTEVQEKLNSGGGSGTTDYGALNNKPAINGTVLKSGDNTLEELGIGTYNKPDSGIPESDLSEDVQEKINTSGDIADSQDSFVADRKYVKGELVYINGILYRLENTVLAGDTMVVGNDIAETTISEEIERVNGDLSEIQDKISTMSGFDSFNINTDVTSRNGGVWTRVFTDISMIGGEDYLFICTPKKNAMNYRVRISSHDGTVIETEGVTSSEEYLNQHRFTFTPTDTGLYIVDFAPGVAGSGSYNVDITYNIELEYTQSQGISAIQTMLSNLQDVPDDIDAIEELVNQQQAELEGLSGIVDRVDGLENDIESQEDEIDVIDKEINNLEECARNNLIPYACNEENENILTVAQDGNEVTINGTASATAGQGYTKVSLNGKLYSWNSATAPSAIKIYNIKLITGHTYKLKIGLISGTLDPGEGTGVIAVSIFNENETRLASVNLDSEADAEVTFVSTGDNIRISLFIARLTVLTNAKISVELSDKSIEDISELYSDISQLSADMALKQDVLTFDDAPTKDSNNPVKSGGIYNSIKEQIENSTGVKILEYTDGYAITLGSVGSVVDLNNPDVTTNWAYAIGDVAPGQSIKAMLTNGSSSYRAFAFINENNEILQKATSNSTAGEVTLIAPPNASKIIINVYKYTINEHWAIIYPFGSDKPWSGLYVSLLGDSISALQYYIPSGNGSYYGPNKGTEYQRSITQPQQMWWYQVITGLGGTPLIIDAWSGSSVAVDGGDAGTVAMCELSRCNNLHAWVQTTQDDPDAVEVTELNIAAMRTSPFLPSYTPAIGDYAKRINPDIVLSTGGTNDWTYATTAESIGTYDGHTGLADPYGESPADDTFREAYATMLCRIQKEYPFALVICSTGFFNCRPYTTKYNCNLNVTSGLTMQDYATAIREIAELRACPVVSVWENGFNRYNYYDTFAGDSANHPTHPNITGHKIIAENAIKAYAEVCRGYTTWLRNN